MRVAHSTNRFEVHYQPQFRIRDGAITGFEALARWRHPDRGLIPPDTFIPMAERSTLIVQLGSWVLAEACREAGQWPERVTVSVNVSAVELRDPGFVPRVGAVLGESGLAPGRLVLEVSEAEVLRAGGVVMTALRALGVRIAVHDFGTSPAGGWHDAPCPIDRVKIGRSFVDGLGRDALALATVRRVTAAARSLGVPVTAEGVETRAQLAALAAEACSDVQGHLYSGAVPAAAATRLLRQSEGVPTG